MAHGIPMCSPQVLRALAVGGTATLARPIGHEHIRATHDPPVGVPHCTSCGVTMEISHPRGYGLHVSVSLSDLVEQSPVLTCGGQIV